MAAPQTVTPAKASATKPKAKRTMLTPTQRVEKMRADLAAAEEKARLVNANKAAKFRKDKADLVVKRDKLNTEIEALDAKIEAHEPSASVQPELSES